MAIFDNKTTRKTDPKLERIRPVEKEEKTEKMPDKGMVIFNMSLCSTNVQESTF
jgi:hypothetical protein